jgi:hypothetical protein
MTVMPVRSKQDALLTLQPLASLSVQERVLLFCLASGTVPRLGSFASRRRRA